jgi:hypothetical protein
METKYGKHIITKSKAGKIATDEKTHLIYLDDDVIKGAFYLECLWFWKGTDKAEVEAHTHDFDEVITFFGSNPEDPRDLCGEVELWLEDEKHILTESCVVFVPKGMKHGPLFIRRVDRPIFHFSSGPASKYAR